MLRLPGNLTATQFLEDFWQKQPLFMPRGLSRLRPSITRNELGWLATLDEVESRLVFSSDDSGRRQYYAETGPFSAEYLSRLPKNNWTLLVHDVEKHLPAMRRLLSHVPFIPDWRIDDVMVSFAAPGGGVGPHRDNYDVFLCQGIGIRDWRYTTEDVDDDRAASGDLALLAEFDGGDSVEASQGDVLYLPPGVGHWGIARRACMTYSIGLRAPQAGDLAVLLDCETRQPDAFYQDADLTLDEARPGLIANSAARRATTLLGLDDSRREDVGEALGKLVTQPKNWLSPEPPGNDEVEALLNGLLQGGPAALHGMALVAYDQRNLYLNGDSRRLPAVGSEWLERLSASRRLRRQQGVGKEQSELLRWMLERGAFEIPEIS